MEDMIEELPDLPTINQIRVHNDGQLSSKDIVKAITTSLHSRSVLGRVIVESFTKELQLERTFGCE